MKPQILSSPTFFDHRGSFTPINLNILDKNWIQSNISISDKSNTFRGMHYQKQPFSQAKLVKVIKGKIMDYIVDLRTESPDFMKLQEFELNEQNCLFVPREFAHGFLTLEDNTIVQYLVDNDYSKENEMTLFWNEIPELNLKLQNLNLILSEKDKP